MVILTSETQLSQPPTGSDRKFIRHHSLSRRLFDFIDGITLRETGRHAGSHMMKPVLPYYFIELLRDNPTTPLDKNTDKLLTEALRANLETHPMNVPGDESRQIVKGHLNHAKEHNIATPSHKAMLFKVRKQIEKAQRIRRSTENSAESSATYFVSGNVDDLSADFLKDPSMLDPMLTIENPTRRIGHDRLADLAAIVLLPLTDPDAPDGIHPVLKELLGCGEAQYFQCPTHGEKASGSYSGYGECHLSFCPDCASDLGCRVSRRGFPNLHSDGEVQYLSCWLQSELALPAARTYHALRSNLAKPDPAYTTDTDESILTEFSDALGKISRRKLERKGTATYGDFMLQRAISFDYQGESDADASVVVKYKLLLKCTRPVAEAIVSALATMLDAEVMHLTGTYSGPWATLQAIEDTRSNLVNISEDFSQRMQLDILSAHYLGLKGRHSFQPLGEMNAILAAQTDKPARPTCDVETVNGVCGLPLKQIRQPDAPRKGNPAEQTTHSDSDPPPFREPTSGESCQMRLEAD